MFKRFIEMLRSERTLPLPVRLHLVDGLFHPFASLIAGALGGLWIAGTAALLVEDLLVRTVAGFIVLVAFVRILIGLYYLRWAGPADATNARQWELAYGTGAALFAFSLGVVTLLALLRVDNAPLHLMLTTTTAGYAASITGRNAGRPWIALSQLYLAAAPMCLGLVLHSTTFYQFMGYTLFLFLFGMTDITLSVRRTLVGALETELQNRQLASSFQQQAELFDDALSNMSHGLCMFDGAGQLLVWNQKFAQILGCSESDFKKGMTLDDLLVRLDPSRSPAASGLPLLEAITHSFGAKRARQVFVNLADERVISVSHQRMEDATTVVVFEDVTEQAKANERIRQLAWTDELTGLMNRASFQELLKKTLDPPHIGGGVALHLIDLDHFKSVNDTLGHPIGDLLLLEVSTRITDCCGQKGHVARLGGDEFVVIQPLEAGDVPEQLAKQLIAALGRTFEINGHRINIGASIGIARSPEHGSNGDVLLKRADMALYEAKAHGRNSSVMFQSDLDLQAQQRRQIELDIRTAVAEEQFSLAFQPIVALGTGRIDSLEALIRWKHPTRGYVSPAEFIPVAEETGLVVEIGRWVLQTACAAAAEWEPAVSLAVNFSAVQFQDREFPQFLALVLERTGLPAHRLELEITETALLKDNSENRNMLEQIRALGVGISLDDFGTGYSSLSQLRTFPFTKIKIDGSFVRDLGRDQSSVAVIQAVTSIGSILGMSVVAECVESEEQLQFIVSAGCTHVQGYLLGRPAVAADVPQLLASFSPLLVERYLAA
jgi:diguanylate cyclase (GGDEF)-like protein